MKSQKREKLQGLDHRGDFHVVLPKDLMQPSGKVIKGRRKPMKPIKSRTILEGITSLEGNFSFPCPTCRAMIIGKIEIGFVQKRACTDLL